MAESVTITISKENHYNQFEPIKVGEIIKLKSKKHKRFMLEVTSSSYNGATMKTVYKPSPKSQLKNSSVFTKIKCKILL